MENIGNQTLTNLAVTDLPAGTGTLGAITCSTIAQGDTLANQQLATMVQVQDGLLLWQLGLDKPHARPLYSFTDGLCVIAVVFVGFQVRLNEVRRHHSNSMPQPGQLS